MKDSVILILDSGRTVFKSFNDSPSGSLLGVSWDIMLPAIIAILVSIAGYFASTFLGKFRIAKANLEALKERTEYINHCFDLFIMSTKRQEENFRDFAASLRALSTGSSNFYLQVQPELEFQNVRSLDRELIFNVFMRYRVGTKEVIREHFDQLYLCIGGTISLYEKHGENFQDFLKDKEIISIKMSNALDNLRVLHESNVISHGNDAIIYSKVKEIREELSADAHKMREIAPFIERIRDEADKVNSSLAVKYAELARVFLFEFSEYERIVNSQIEIYEEYADKLKEFSDRIEIVMTFFDSLHWIKIALLRPSTWGSD